MSRPLFLLFAFAVLTPGCFPVNEPLGDIDKAEPANDLIGEWIEQDKITKKEVAVWTVDRPEIKGHPKGLMRAKSVDAGIEIWFFVIEINKQRYLHILLVEVEGVYPDFAKMGKEGEYEMWAKNDKHGYGIMRLKVESDNATIIKATKSEAEVMIEVMKAANIINRGGIYQTTAGWFKKYLEKNDPEKFFSKSEFFLMRKQK